MRKNRRILHLQIILIYFTFIYSHNIHHSNYRHSHASATTDSDETNTNEPLSATKTTLSSGPFSDGQLDDLPSLSSQNNHGRMPEFIKTLFDLKGEPAQLTPGKVYVPRAMLEAYMKMRDEVRNVIPDDKDFLGKINIDDMYDQSGDIWSAVYNKYGEADIKVDMGPQTSSPESYRFKGEASHMGSIPSDEPEDVPPSIEPILPPHSRSMKNQRQFQSVHLKFNLSRAESYQESTALDDLRGADLYLSRERLYNCLFHECSKRKPLPFFTKSKDNETSLIDEMDQVQDAEGVPVPSFQRVYILQVYGYDQFNEPRTKIHESQRIRTADSTPLIFNVYPIVKSWLMDPKSNYGIIIRVTNDDKTYEEALRHSQQVRKTKLTRSLAEGRPTNSSATQATNASDSYKFEELQHITPSHPTMIPDHVRLKREFRSTSEKDEEWEKHRPWIMVYSDAGRRHVKRHHDDADSMQADADTMPFQTSTISQVPTSTTATSTLTSSDHSPQQSPSQISNIATTTTASTTTSETFSRPSASTAGSWNRRDNVPGRPRTGSARNYSGGSQRTQQSGNQRSKNKSKQSSRQIDKCSKRSLMINFDQVGWSNWIIAPQAYYANYCAGNCSWPLADTQNATNHAIIQAIYESVGRQLPRSCCAPVKLGPMAILYQLDGVVQMRKYDDMIVDACGCL